MSPFLLNKNRKIMLFQVKQKSEARKLSGKRKPWVSTQLRDWIYRTTARSWVTTEPWPTASAASSWGNRTTAPAVIGLEWAGIRRWLPASLIFAPASNSGPIRESQICSPSQSHKMPSFLLGGLQLPQANTLQSEHTCSLPLFSLPAWVATKLSEGGWLPCCR